MKQEVVLQYFKQILLSLAVLCALCAATVSHALPFSIVPKVGTTLPVEIDAGETANAYYTVTNNTASARNNNYVKYLPPNVRQVTTGGTYPDTCGVTFNLAAKGTAGDSCTLQLNVFGAVDATDPNPRNHLFVCFPGGVTCAGTNYPLNVTVLTLVSIAVTPATQDIFIGETQQYTAIGNLSNGTSINLSSSVTWQSSDTTVATISATGLATGVGEGTTNITATQEGITSTPATLNVAPVVLQSIEIVPTTAEANRGQTVQYTATGNYSDGTTVDITTQVAWQSSNETIATIDANGLASALEVGETTITALLDGVLSNEGALTVVNPLTSISIAPAGPTTIDVNQTQQYTATGTYADGTPATITNEVTWASTNTSVATISATGLATGVAEGSTMITASLDGITSNASTLNVADPLVSIVISPSSVSIVPNATQQFTATGTFTSGATRDITATATWTSTNMGVATINSSGLATGVAVGTTNITAEQDGVTSNTSVLTVNSFIYVVNTGFNNIAYCNLDAAGDFAGCLASTAVPNARSFTIAPPRTRAYITTATQVNLCSLNFTNGNITSCVDAVGSTFTNVGQVAVHPNNTFAYIVSSTGVSRCIIESDGTLTSCNITGEITANLNGIAINPAGTFAYLTAASSVNYCDINQTTGALFNCQATGPAPITNPGEIAINPAGTFAYIADFSNDTVLNCAINIDGSLNGVCGVAPVGFSEPVGVAINAAGSIIYVTNSDLLTVRYCDIDPVLGTLSGCADETGFNLPFGIAIN